MINVLFAYFLLECHNNFSQIQVACHEIPQRTNEKNKTFMGKVGSKLSILKPYIPNRKLPGTHMLVTLFPWPLCTGVLVCHDSTVDSEVLISQLSPFQFHLPWQKRKMRAKCFNQAVRLLLVVEYLEFVRLCPKFLGYFSKQKNSRKNPCPGGPHILVREVTCPGNAPGQWQSWVTQWPGLGLKLSSTFKPNLEGFGLP